MWERVRVTAWTMLLTAQISGCGGATESSNVGLTVTVEGQTLLLKVDPQAHLRYETCALVQGLDQQVGTSWVPVRDDLPGTYYQRSTPDGYMLDGKFVLPSASAGCDLVECDVLPDGQGVGVAVEYVATGTTAPPADYVYEDPFVRPDTIDVYESRPLHATRVRTHIEYFTDTACKDRRKAALEVAIP